MQEDYFSFTNRLFDPSKIYEKPEVLKGIRVLDISHMIYGPNTAKILAQFGAEVIKVELPFYGDYWRTATYWGKFWKHSNPLWHFINHSKYFITIDVKKPKGRELILKLAKISDVFIENFAPGTVEAWGIGYSQVSKINPKIIYVSLSTFGQFGPLKFQPGWDLIAQGVSGWMSVTGYPEIDSHYKIPDYLGDFYPSHFAVLLILAALFYRQKTGKGQYIDLSQAEVLMRSLYHFTYETVTGKELGRTGNFDPTMVPSGIFKTSDGKFIALAIATDEQFEAFCKAMGRVDLFKNDRFRNVLSRLKPENAKELCEITKELISSKTAFEIIDLAKKYGFSASEVMDDVKICNDEWRRQRGSVVHFKDEMYGEFVLAGPIVMLSKTPGRIKWLSRPLGYHNRYVFMKLLGLSEREIKQLEKEGVIGYWDNRVGLKPPIGYDIEKDPVFNYKIDKEREKL
ncbi:MAG: CoA transferase [Candidatus Korarchaeota archaeon]|nr:CoA transferase [Thermoproteota archaeon]